MNYLTQSELASFFAAIESPRDRALFTLAYWRGLRASEISMIQRQDIDMDAGKIHFSRLKGSYGGAHDLQNDELDTLKPWLSDPQCPQSAVFPVKRAQVFNLFRKYAQKANLPLSKQHPHILKHTIATHLLDAGMDITKVKDWLGHRAIKNTMVYAEVTNKQRQEAAAQMREYVKRSTK